MMNLSKELVRKWSVGLISAGVLLGGVILPDGVGNAAASQAKSKAENSHISSSELLNMNRPQNALTVTTETYVKYTRMVKSVWSWINIATRAVFMG